MKTKDERKVNVNIKKLNRQLAADVFGDRFYARQVRKDRNDGITYYLIELIDREQPDRNKLCHGWLTAFEIYRFNKVWEEMNNFIITSDFWTKYRANQTR